MVCNNSNLNTAKIRKNDEYYTLYTDIKKEMESYVTFNPQVFRDKTILLPCDNAKTSNFAKYFKDNYERFGIKQLIISDSDFRSREVREVRDKSDIIITNPPFSLIREFVRWVEPDKRLFTIIVPLHLFSYSYIVQFLMNNSLRISINRPYCYVTPGNLVQKFGNMYWLTNIPCSVIYKQLELRTMQDNLTSNQRLKNILLNKFGQLPDDLHYEQYDDYAAIDVPFVSAIPSDYDGVMGVPLSFLPNYNPFQFEILGTFGSTKIDNINLAPPRVRGIYQFCRIAIKRKDV